jgi:hypothetical protein
MERLRGEYEYPGGINLDPDSEMHRKLLKFILTAAKEAYDVIQNRFDTWSELDEKLTVYIDLDSEEEDIQNTDERKPVSIVVPITYATRETLLTYWVAAFLRSPIFRYMPSRDPNDVIGVMLLENVIEQHTIRSKASLDLHTMWSDAFTYGFGAVSPTWRVERGYRTTYDTEIERILGFPVRKKEVRRREEITQFEGNALTSLDTYNCLPDPNVPIIKVQDMDYFGWSERGTYNALLMDEKMSGGSLFNIKYLHDMGDRTSSYYNSGSEDTGRYTKTGLSIDRPDQIRGKPVDIINMYMWIIPSEYGLGDSEYPEIWKFAVAADRVIIEASELGLDHNKIPVCTMSPDSDGHTTMPVSILEREYPLQHAIDWLWQSHVANVRKTINNMLVVDPSLINMNDLVDTKYGMVARLRAAAWGRGVTDAVEQLQVQDVTKGHIGDIGFLMNIDNLVFTSNQAKGSQERKGERVSAQEARDTRMAKLGAIQAHYDIAYQFASNTIQLMEEEQVVKLSGEYTQQLIDEYAVQADFFKVSPKALDVRWDVIPQDGTIPGGEYADVWERLMNNAAAHPELYQSLDFVRIWKHIARLLGAKDPDAFMKRPVQTKTLPQEQIDAGVQQGRFVPATEAPEGVV